MTISSISGSVQFDGMAFGSTPGDRLFVGGRLTRLRRLLGPVVEDGEQGPVRAVGQLHDGVGGRLVHPAGSPAVHHDQPAGEVHLDRAGEVGGGDDERPVVADDLGAGLGGEAEGVALAAGGADVPGGASGRGQGREVLRPQGRVRPEAAGGHDHGPGPNLVPVHRHAHDPAGVGDDPVDPPPEGDVDTGPFPDRGGQGLHDAVPAPAGDMGAGLAFLGREHELGVELRRRAR